MNKTSEITRKLLYRKEEKKKKKKLNRKMKGKFSVKDGRGGE